MSPAAALYLIVMCGLLPWAAIKSARAVNADPSKLPSFEKYVKVALFTQVFMLALSLWTARNIDLLPRLFPRPHFEARFLWIGLLALAVTLGTLPIRRKLVSDELKRRMYKRMPHNGPQLAQWALVALMAGVGEEIAYRGVLFMILSYWLGGWWPAALIASAAFSLAHVIQGWWVALWIFAFSLGFHGLVYYCGDLYTAMIVHFLYDLLIGIIAGFFLRPPPPTQPA
jgi:membrane protease YdiL (CAAX protease family)